MVACLLQMSSACLSETHASPDCPSLPQENAKSKPPFPGSFFIWGSWPGPFPPDMWGHHFSVRKMEGDTRGKQIPCPRPTCRRENFSFLSNSEILTGITSQDSKCFLSCHNPLKFFFSPFPCDSVSVSHSLSAWLGAPPPPCKSRGGTRKEA